ncbi:hypothetical protein [Chitinophaga agri]|uniref:DUF4177 domain-containing protein n=1 Tax=Chitinophaga agri TaxID=2703787 RepID=A0A6B9ZE15_9BACT|nr:hypothetical protein [Chitinophaga agri]QHS58773.1 hypothetical protein GWR21_03890 [Chitinophaga agri]
MKQLFISILFLLPVSAFAQEKVEQYCEVVAQARMMSNKVTIDVDFGEERRLFEMKDHRIKDELGKVKKFNSVVDALNYMGGIGWKLVNAFPITSSTGTNVYHFYFKREFDKSELDTDKSTETK